METLEMQVWEVAKAVRELYRNLGEDRELARELMQNFCEQFPLLGEVPLEDLYLLACRRDSQLAWMDHVRIDKPELRHDDEGHLRVVHEHDGESLGDRLSGSSGRLTCRFSKDGGATYEDGSGKELTAEEFYTRIARVRDNFLRRYDEAEDLGN